MMLSVQDMFYTKSIELVRSMTIVYDPMVVPKSTFQKTPWDT